MIIEGTTRFGPLTYVKMRKVPGPCRICGCRAVVDGGGPLSHRCECTRCGSATMSFRTWEEAVDEWNLTWAEIWEKYFGEDDNGQH